MQSDANFEIARTYFLEGIRMGQKGPDGREVVLQNFAGANSQKPARLDQFAIGMCCVVEFENLSSWNAHD